MANHSISEMKRPGSAYGGTPSYVTAQAGGRALERGEELPTSGPVSLESFLKPFRQKNGRVLKSEEFAVVDEGPGATQTYFTEPRGSLYNPREEAQTSSLVSPEALASSRSSIGVSSLQPASTMVPTKRSRQRPPGLGQSRRSSEQSANHILDTIEAGDIFRYSEQENGDLSVSQRDITRLGNYNLIGVVPRSMRPALRSSIHVALQEANNRGYSRRESMEFVKVSIIAFVKSLDTIAPPTHSINGQGFNQDMAPMLPGPADEGRLASPYDMSLVSPVRRNAYDPAKYNFTAQYPRYNPSNNETTQQDHRATPLIGSSPSLLRQFEDDPFISNQGVINETQQPEQLIAGTVSPLQQLQEKTRVRVEKMNYEKSISSSPINFGIRAISSLGRTVLRDPYQAQTRSWGVPRHLAIPSEQMSHADLYDPYETQSAGLGTSRSWGAPRHLVISNEQPQYPDELYFSRGKSEFDTYFYEPTTADTAKDLGSGSRAPGSKNGAFSLLGNTTNLPSNEEELATFWSSGSRSNEQRTEYCNAMLATRGQSSLTPEEEACTRALYTVFDNLMKLKEDSKRNPPDCFTNFSDPPEYCIDRSSAVMPGMGTVGGVGHQRSVSMFGEQDWVNTPQRVGRDPRYRHFSRIIPPGGRGSGFHNGPGRSAMGMHGRGRLGQ